VRSLAHLTRRRQRGGNDRVKTGERREELDLLLERENGLSEPLAFARELSEYERGVHSQSIERLAVACRAQFRLVR
jgi:hypothetical protein